MSAFLSVVDLDISVRINPRYFEVSNSVSNLYPSHDKYIILIDLLQLNMDDSYSTNNEAALAVVATSMKKARLPIEVLIVNSFMGGLLFSTGGMIFDVLESYNPGLKESNPGIIVLLQGFAYPIGLFYVVITGTDLFNSNILFFSVGLVRGAVSILDLIISWLVSYWINLVANIFVCYVICHFSHISQKEDFVKGSIEALMQKASFSFVDNLIKGMAGNFFVCLGIYLQIMVRPVHVKFLMLLLPIFSLVSIGFTHSVADMYIVLMGLINHAPISVGKVAWKIMLPGALGNIIGGSFFGIVIPWYLHLYSVERDQRKLNLPEYDARDEQPQINSDSRVVKNRSRTITEEFEEVPESLMKTEKRESSSLSSENNVSVAPPEQLVDNFSGYPENLIKISSRASGASRFSVGNARYAAKSPKNVFPVYGMAPLSERERSIASGMNVNTIDEDLDSIHTARTEFQNDDDSTTATYIGDHVKKFLSNLTVNKQHKDIESQNQDRPPVIRSHSTQSYHAMNRSHSRPHAIGINQFLQRSHEFANRPTSRAAATVDAVPLSTNLTTATRNTEPNNVDNIGSIPFTQPENISPGQSINSEFQTNNSTPPVQSSDQSSFNIVNYQPKSHEN